MFFSPHLIISGIIIIFIYLIGIQNLIKYFKTRIASLLYHSLVYFAGATAFLLAVIPTLLSRPKLFPNFLKLGVPVITIGLFFYVLMMNRLLEVRSSIRLVSYGLVLILGAVIEFLIFKFPPAIQITTGGWTKYIFPAQFKFPMLVLFQGSMFAGSVVFVLHLLKAGGKKSLKIKSGILAIGYFLLAVGVYLVIMGEPVLFNFLLLAGYILVFSVSLWRE